MVAMGLTLPNSVIAKRNKRNEAEFRGILSRMTLDEKVGQLLMAYLDAETLENQIENYRCGTMLVWGNLKGVDARGLCERTNRAQALSLRHRKLPLWIHGYLPGLGWRPGWLQHASRVATPRLPKS